MYSYEFISDRISEPAVKAIVARADYYPAHFTYRRRTEPTGYVVEGNDRMSVEELEKAAKKLGIWLCINAVEETADAALEHRD
jgi:hypothetical protein